MKTVVVEGVADMQSGGGAVLERGSWRGVVFLRPWHGPDGKIHADTLRVLLPPAKTSGPAARAAGRVRSGTSLRLTVLMSPKKPGRLPSAELQGRLRRAAPAAALARANTSLNQPLTIHDTTLGRLARAAKSTCLIGRFRDGKRLCRLVVWQLTGASVETTVAKASAIVRRATANLPALPALAATKLLKLANQWRAATERPPLTAAQLTRRLRLREISVPGTANALQLDYSCGDVFGEHGIEVTLTRAGRFRRAQMH